MKRIAIRWVGRGAWRGICLVLCVLVGSVARAGADMRGQVVCGVPADEAVILTWQTTAGAWSIRTPAPGGRIPSFSSEESALAGWESDARFVCQVAIRYNFREFIGRLYRLNDEMSAGDSDPRSLIVGEPDLLDVEGSARQGSERGLRERDTGFAAGEVASDAARSRFLRVFEERLERIAVALEEELEREAPRRSGSSASSREALPESPVPEAREVSRLRRPGEVFRECDVCPEMVVMPEGDLAVGRFEVTVGEYRAFVSAAGGGAEPCSGSGARRSWRDPGFGQTDSHPVTCVSWHDAQAYLAWLSSETGVAYRLLSGDEWDRVAVDPRDGFQCGPAREFEEGTCPVGGYGATARGLFDVMGNVSEWTAECLSTETCVQRGAGFGIDPFSWGTEWRRSWYASERESRVGFRVARAMR